MVAVPVADPDLAVIVAVPARPPVTVPFDDTVAMSELLVVHVTEALMIAPDGSRTVAVNETVPPSAFTVAVDGVMVTVRTPGAPTVTVAVPT